MAKQIELKAKQNFKDKETGISYKRGKTYSFSEKRAEELLKNEYIVEKVSENIDTADTTTAATTTTTTEKTEK